jgi:hypothetical protein
MRKQSSTFRERAACLETLNEIDCLLEGPVIVVPFYRDLQPLRSSVHSSEGISPQLNSLVLIRRPDGLIDVGKFIDILVDVQTILFVMDNNRVRIEKLKAVSSIS